MKQHIPYKDLLTIISWGIFTRKVKGTGCDTSDLKPIKGAFYGGIYLGSPGKDIYLMLPYLNDEQIDEVASQFVNKFPTTPPGNHVNTAACIRYIYGQFEKQGILRSKKDMKRMSKEELFNKWILPRKFLNIVCNKFKNISNYYGLCIYYEMEGHRLGDEAILNRDIDKLNAMEIAYCKSVKYALRCKSYKQLFTPYYWATRYFILFSDIKNSIKYSKLTIEYAEKYCPDARRSYVEKLLHCLNCLKKTDEKNWKSFYNNCKKKFKNKSIKMALKEI